MPVIHWQHYGHPGKWHTLEFEGNHIGVLDVKRDILKSRLSAPSLHKLWNEAFDYALFDAHSTTPREFDDESATLPKNTHLVVKRLPDLHHFLARRLFYNEPRVGGRALLPTTRHTPSHKT